MLNYAYNAPQGMSLADLAAGVQNDPAFQEMLRQEELRRQEEERRRLAMETAQQNLPSLVDAATNRQRMNFEDPMTDINAYKQLSSLVQPDQLSGLRDRIINRPRMNFEDPAIDIAAYTALKGPQVSEKDRLDIEAKRIANEKARSELTSGGMTKKDRLTVLSQLAKDGMTLDENDNIVPLQGRTSPVETVGSAEWKRKQEVDAAALKRQTDAEKLAEKEKGAATYLQGQQAAMQRQLADIAGLNVADFTPEQLASYYGQGAPRQGEAVDRIESAVGVIDSLIPQVFRSQNKQDVLAGINSMKEVAQTFGLQQLRAAGVAPGSVTEREWSKFEQMLGNLDPSQSGDRMYNQLRQIYKQLETAKASLAPQESAPAQTAGPTPGTVKNGYVYIGGNPADKNSWKPVGGQ